MGQAAMDQANTRVFYALWPSPELAESLYELGGRFAAKAGGRRTRPETLHLTLAFIGEVVPSQLQSLLEIGRRLPPPSCELTLDRLGRFGGKSIVWAGCSRIPPELLHHFECLQTALSEAGFAVEERPFVPHVSLLRKVGPQALPDEHFHLRWTVDAWQLAVSEPDAVGRIYRPVEVWAA